MKINWKQLIIAVLIPLAVGGLSALLSGGGMEGFQALNQPPLSPRPLDRHIHYYYNRK